jgi:hypothetical protein
MLARHLRLLICKLSALLLLGFAATVAFGSDPRQVAAAQALIDRAEQLSRLTQPGSYPFLLQLQVDRKPSKMNGKGGAFSLWWLAEDRWRESAEAGDLTAIQVRNEQGLWLPADLDPKLRAIFADGKTFPFRERLVAWDEQIAGLKQYKVHGVEQSCVQVQRPDRKRELCFDQQTGLLTSAASSLPLITSAPNQLDPVVFITEYHDYARFGDKLLPKEIRSLRRGDVIGTIHLTSLRAGNDQHFTADLLAAPAGYQLWPDCDHYWAAQFSRDFWRAVVAQLHQYFFVNGRTADGVQIVISPAGKPQEVQLINPFGKPSKELISYFMSQSYRPATCDGIPVLGFLSMTFEGL